MQSRTSPAWTEAERAYRWLGVAGALVFLALFIVLALRRMPYPYELEWMEGGMVDEVRRILQGQALYVAPSVDYIPYVYSPGFFYVAAGFSWLLGVGFLPLRLVSFLSTLGCFGMLYLIVRRETGDRALGWMAAGLEAATFHISGSWLDIARSDSLFLLLFLLAVYWLRFHASFRGYAIAGALFAAAFFAKQTALFAASPLILWAIVTNWRRGLVCALVFGALVGGISLGWDFFSHGWYRYYVFELPKHHAIVKGMWLKFWSEDLLKRFPIPLLLAVPFFAIRATGSPRWFYASLAVGMIGASWLIRVRAGSYDNILIPAYAALALLAALGAFALASEPRLRGWLYCAAMAAIAVQLVLLWYPPAKEVPTEADRQAGDNFVHRLAEIGGDQWIPSHGYLASEALGQPHAQTVAIGDVLTGGGPQKDALRSAIQSAIHERRFSAIAMDFSDSLFTGELKDRYKKVEGDIFKDRGVFFPVTGNRARPRTLWVLPPPDKSPPASMLPDAAPKPGGALFLASVARRAAWPPPDSGRDARAARQSVHSRSRADSRRRMASRCVRSSPRRGSFWPGR